MHAMRPWLLSLILGVGVGVIYGAVRVRSPAPPLVALIGLLGMLIGEQAVSFVRSRLEASRVATTAKEPLERKH
jgi:XapX domain-containing protein